MADEGEQGNGLGTKCRSEGPAAAESPELEEIEQQVAAKEAELEAARQRLHEQREWHKRMQSEKMRQKMQELDSEIQSLASGKDDLETRIRVSESPGNRRGYASLNLVRHCISRVAPLWPVAASERGGGEAPARGRGAGRQAALV